ncbi:uncharacterized protein LOC143028589 [Oratosquilla oratoria]|uniref:uncharacterized protein LOC143027441 n=1 Tax=Oratosquilla oratoria TaxID=337810 RepID=UPI003F75D7B7
MVRFSTYMMVVAATLVALADSKALDPVPPPTCTYYCLVGEEYQCCDKGVPDDRCGSPKLAPVKIAFLCTPGEKCRHPVPKECKGPRDTGCGSDEFCCYVGSESSTDYGCATLF